MVPYLSSEWLAVAAEAIAHDDQVQALGSTPLTVEVTVGEVLYSLRSGNGSVSLHPGPAAGADLRIAQSHETAVAIASGTASAQEAFIGGHVRFDGPAECLSAARSLLEAIGAALEPLRSKTVY
ncbi:MAG: SCP2 sterol-binding domain-containing protein [Acidimicrobiia bacterium]